MKKIILLFTILLGYSQMSLITAQSDDPGLGLSFKLLFMDYNSQYGGSYLAFQDYHYGFEVAVHKEISDRLNVVVPFKLGVVNQFDLPEQYEYLRKTVYGIDAQLTYDFLEGADIVPYGVIGLGAVGESPGEFNIQIPIGVGFKTPIFENAYFNYQLEYRYSLGEDRNNIHHGLGFIYMLGAVDDEDKDMNDRDMDGVPDSVDLCPDVPGLEAYNGCPDSDGDGIADYMDDCPTLAGPESTKGCPDSDGDGVADKDDDCPEEYGTAANNGCPEDKDSDNDGVLDSEDECPNIPGTISNKGCPEGIADRDGDGVADDIDKCPDQAGSAAFDGCPDTDGDGIPDIDDMCPSKPGPKIYNGCPDTDGDGIHDGRDRCPTTPGTVALGGCPEIDAKDQETLDIAMRAVQFDTGKATLKPESYDVLGQIASILRRYPDFNLAIEGHTDNVGAASNNQVLSEKRAKSCYDYLVNQGISAKRLSYAGYGESRPVSDNNSLRGRTLNRRVEFKLVAPGK